MPDLTVDEQNEPQTQCNCSDECESKEVSEFKGVTVEIDLNQLDASQQRTLSEIERKLFEIGITFDTGAGGGKRHWEWDWSLKGPIKLIPRN